MRIYAFIFSVAVALLALLYVIGMKAFPEFLATEDFRKSLFVEAISFVFTTAIIGSVSAAVMRYLDVLKTKGVISYRLEKIDGTLSAAINSYIQILKEADIHTIDYRRKVAFGNAILPKYISLDSAIIKSRIIYVSEKLNEASILLDDCYNYLPVNLHHDMDKVSDAISEFMQRVSVAENLFGGDNKYDRRYLIEDRTNDRDGLRLFSQISDFCSTIMDPNVTKRLTSASIAANKTFLYNDFHYIDKVAYFSDLHRLWATGVGLREATQRVLGSIEFAFGRLDNDARYHGFPDDLNATLSDSEARVFARVAARSEDDADVIDFNEGCWWDEETWRSIRKSVASWADPTACADFEKLYRERVSPV